MIVGQSYCRSELLSIGAAVDQNCLCVIFRSRRILPSSAFVAYVMNARSNEHSVMRGADAWRGLRLASPGKWSTITRHAVTVTTDAHP